METFGLYSLKAGILLALFWGIYRVCLQKETFHRFNRFFLLFGMGVAVLLPLYSVHYTVEVRTIDPSAFLITDHVTAVVTDTNEDSALLQLCYRLLPVIYITGICILFIFRFFGISRLFVVIRKNQIKQYVNYNLIESSDFQGTFSFFWYIFISGRLQENEKRIILKHEEAHIRQKHWVDLLLINRLNLFWWFNPVIWLYEKAIRNNHEYLADQAVLTDHEQAEYQKTLVNQWLKVPVFPVTNSFSYSNQLKRINMMKKNNSSPVKQLFALLSIPALALFLWAFAEPEYIQVNNNTSDTALQKDSVIHAFVSQENLYAVQNESESVLHLQHPVVIEEGEKQPLLLIDGQKSETSIENIDPAQIHSVVVFKDETALEIYGEEGKNGVIEIITKKEHTTITTPALQENTNATQGYLDNISQLQEPKTFTIRKSPLVIIDGKKTDKDLNTVDPATISSLSVLKDEESLTKYGEDGKNGVVTITTKRGRTTLLDQSGIEIEGNVVDEKNEPIPNATVYVHGTETMIFTDKKGKFTLRILPDDCIRIYADNYSMVNLFPDIRKKQQQTIQLKQDVGLIETKKPEPITTTSLESGKDAENFTELENRLVVLNGEITDISFNKLDINPEDIAHITVLKDKSAIQLYGEKAKNGVILITTKQ